MAPSVIGMSPITNLPKVVFPQPDSPTIPTVSPLLISMSTPSTALTWALTGENIPALIGNHFLALLIVISGPTPFAESESFDSGDSIVTGRSPLIVEIVRQRRLVEPSLGQR